MEYLLDDSLEVPDLFGVGQLGEQVCSGVTLPRYVIDFETFKIVNESLCNVVVLEQHYFLGLVSIGNLSLDKLQVCVTS